MIVRRDWTQRAMTGVLAAILFVSAMAISAHGAPDAWIPLQDGARWLYVVDGGTAKSATILVKSRAADGAWAVAWGTGPATIVPSENGVVVKVIRGVGVAGTPRSIPMADLRWTGDDHWKTNTMSGCIQYALECSREGTETLTVPAGTYSCLKITNKGLGETDTYWLARGIGIVQRLYKEPNREEKWALKKFAP